MGTGKNGTFDKNPEWQQWAILSTQNCSIESINNENRINILYGKSIERWLKFFKTEHITILLSAIEGHGKWDNQTPFENNNKPQNYVGPIAVLTRATIRLSKLNAFWKNVPAVSKDIMNAEGFITSIGIGEIPFIKQATFSIWESEESMKNFAYKMKNHRDVIQKTRKENWYAEEMFTRFIPIKTFGKIADKNAFDRML